MPLAVQHASPSTLVDVLKQCIEALDAMGQFLPVLVGRQYLTTGAGSAPRVVFVPEYGGGSLEPPMELGMAARVAHACTVYVRGRESGGDVDRFRETYELADLVVDLVQTAGTGRIEWKSYEDGSPTDTEAFGAEVVFAFVFRRDIPHSAARWGLPMALTDAAKMQPQPPPGIPAEGVTITPTTIPVDP